MLNWKPIWASLLAKALEGKNVMDLLLNVGLGSGAPAARSVVPAAISAAAEPKEEAKEDDDMVRSLAIRFISRY
jgi:large subunit ribosomal protein LP1